MNYSKRGIRKKQQMLRAKMPKLGRMLALAIFKGVLIAMVSACILGVCVGIGMFKGILASSPDISSQKGTYYKYQ